jgi:dipeptidyl aminopeptidase/acylaminoacyl peptidase
MSKERFQVLYKIITLLILLLITLSKVWAAPAESMIPVEAFATLPDVSQLQLSPSGKHVASIVRMDTPEKKGVAINIYDIDIKQSSHPLWLDNAKHVINWIHWVNNEQLLVSARFPARRYGTPTLETRLLIVGTNGKSKSVLEHSFFRRATYIPQFHDNVIDFLNDDPEHILLSLSLSDVFSSSVHKVNLKTGSSVRTVSNTAKVTDWRTDQQHRVRIAVKNQDQKFHIMVRPPDGKKWKTLWTFSTFSEDQTWPLGFDKDPNVLYVNAYHEGRLAIFRVDLTSSPLQQELVYSDSQYDVEGRLIYSNLSGEVIGTTYSRHGGYTFWQDSYKAIQRGIDKALPDTINVVRDFNESERRYIVLATSDTDAGTYWLGDRDTKQLNPIAKRYRALPPERMSEAQRIEYKARDGLNIEAFLTLPKGSEPLSLPTIIFPHGGPISHDSAGFDPWLQYFASRGFAVLKMNFRGSSGYGFDFMKAGLKNWGQEMQNDVEDGTQYLIDKKIADPKKICIVGASYGGYAALMEATKSPNLYQCAISFAGVTDMEYLVTSSVRYTNHKTVKEQFGSDNKNLRRYSPVRHAKNIDIPVLLIHGTKDRTVRVQHSRKMNKALKKAGERVRYIEQNNGDHHLSNPKHRIELFEEMDKFLQEYLFTKLKSQI